MMHSKMGTVGVLGLVLGLWLVGGVHQEARAQVDTAEVQRARELVRANAHLITFFALPTYKHLDCSFNSMRQLDNGFELHYVLEMKSGLRSHTVKMAFYFDTQGRLDFCKTSRWTTLWTPFGSAVGASQYRTLRAFVAEHQRVRNNRDLLRLVEQADARQLCILYLQLEQQP